MYKKLFLIILISVALLMPILAVQAQGLKDATGKLQETGAKAGAGSATVNDVVGTVISTALNIVGLIFLILMVYAGYLWMTAKGEEEPVKKAKDIIIASIIGMVIVLSAYAITLLVTGKLGTL